MGKIFQSLDCRFLMTFIAWIPTIGPRTPSDSLGKFVLYFFACVWGLRPHVQGILSL